MSATVAAFTGYDNKATIEDTCPDSSLAKNSLCPIDVHVDVDGAVAADHAPGSTPPPGIALEHNSLRRQTPSITRRQTPIETLMTL